MSWDKKRWLRGAQRFRARTGAGVGQRHHVDRRGRAIDSYSGKPFEYRLDEDGTATLSSPTADELWKRRHTTMPQRRPPRFTYRVPAAGEAPRQPVSID